MRTTVTLDDKLFDAASRYAGAKERSAVIAIALKAYVELEAGRRLAALGGTMPGLEVPPRRRSEAA